MQFLGAVGYFGNELELVMSAVCPLFDLYLIMLIQVS